MKKSVICLVVLGLILSSFACAAPKPAPTTPAEVSFERETITFVIATSPGGGTDILARVIVRYLPKYFPGKPGMVVRNMPGADAIIGGNYVYLAKPDGLITLFSGGSVLMNQLVGKSAVRYDLLKMPVFVGCRAGSFYYIRTGIIDKPEDLLKAKGLVYGGTGGGAGVFFASAKEVLNFPTEKVVLAYTGTADAFRAFVTGESNMGYATAAMYHETIAALVAKGEAILLFQNGLLDEKGEVVRDPGLPPMPTVYELHKMLYGKPPSGIAWEAFKGVLAARMLDKVGFLPPGTPDSIIKVYWNATERLFKDAEFRKLIDRLSGEGADWVTGETAQKMFQQNYRVDPKVRDWLRSTVTKYGMVVE